jgi:hypothetical protein
VRVDGPAHQVQARADGGVGLEPTVAVWEDSSLDWGAFELAVALYVWGYVT